MKKGCVYPISWVEISPELNLNQQTRLSGINHTITSRNLFPYIIIINQKTKKLIMNRLILMTFIVGLLLSCNNDEIIKMEPALSGFTHSECGGFKSQFKVPVNEETEKLIISSEADGIFKLEHSNVQFNCCLPAGLSADLNLSDDTLYINEIETQPGECRCLCYYDITTEIIDLEAGEYVLCLMKDSIRRGTTTLFFKNNMYEEIMATELNE
jgi:hypothetical protein